MAPKVYTEEQSGLQYLKKDENSKNIIILFHGYGASMMDLYGLSEVINLKNPCDWIFPNGHLELNLGFGMLGRGWFPVDMPALEQAMAKGEARDFSKESTAEFKKALEITDKFVSAFKGEYDNIILGGFSQGSMLTCFLSMIHSQDIKGYLCYSGTLVGQGELVKLMERAEKFPFFQSHGKQDPVLGFSQAQKQYDLFKHAGFKGEFVEFQGAHEIPMEVIQKSQSFLNTLL